jgi:hypothetical protein
MDCAKTHLAEGDAWLQKNIEQRQKHGALPHVFNLQHSTDRAFANAQLYDMAAGAKKAVCWRSKSTCIDALYCFAADVSPSEIPAILAALPPEVSDPVSHAAILAGCFSVDVIPKGSDVKQCLDNVLSSSNLWENEFSSVSEWMVDFSELCLRCRADVALVQKFLEAHPQGEGIPAYYTPRVSWEAHSHDFLRVKSLLSELSGKNLIAEDLLPEKRDGSGYDSNREEIRSMLKKVLPAYKLRAKALHKGWSAKTARIEAKKSIYAWQNSSYSYGEHYRVFFRTYASHIAKTLLLLPGNCPDFVEEILKRGKELLYPEDFIDFCMSIGEICAQKSEYEPKESKPDKEKPKATAKTKTSAKPASKSKEADKKNEK